MLTRLKTYLAAKERLESFEKTGYRKTAGFPAVFFSYFSGRCKETAAGSSGSFHLCDSYAYSVRSFLSYADSYGTAVSRLRNDVRSFPGSERKLPKAWELQPLIYGWILLGGAYGIRRYLFYKAKWTMREKRIWTAVFALLLSGSLFLYTYRILRGFSFGCKGRRKDSVGTYWNIDRQILRKA